MSLDKPSETRYSADQQTLRTCPYCQSLFAPKRKAQQFCGSRCRSRYHLVIGMQGTVAGVTRLKRGVSVVLHFQDGPAADAAINLRKGDVVSSLRVP